MPINDLEYREQKAELLAAHERLRTSAYKAANALIADARALRSILDNGNEILEHPLCHGEWISVYGGKVDMMLLDDAAMCFKPDCQMASPGCQLGGASGSQLCNHNTCTRVLCKSDGGPDINHKHTFDEFIQVVQGEFIEGDRHLRPGQSMYFPAGTFHRPIIRGLVLACWQPPLPRFNQVPELVVDELRP